MDRLTPEERSRLMARVRSKDSSAEIRVRRAAHGLGLRYRLHRRGLPGDAGPSVCKVPCCDFRAWMLLASSPGLQKGDHSKVARGVLEEQIRGERRARP